MTDKERNLIEIGKYIVVMSSLTNKPYISEDRTCYITDTMEEADAYIEKFGDCFKSDKASLSQRVYLNEFLSYGIEHIVLKQYNKDEILMDISTDDMKTRQFFNQDGNADILRLMETSKKKYIRSLVKDKLYAPVIIDQRLLKQYPKIHYCTASSAAETYFILFSTLKDFEEWKGKSEGNWKMLEVTLSDINKERKGNPVLINPLTDKLILTNVQINDVLKEKKKE